MLSDYLFTILQYSVILLSVIVLIRCLRSLLRDRCDSETCAYLRVGKELVPVEHWENIVGRSPSADIRIFGDGLGRLHAILRRSDKGIWSVYDIFARGGIWVNSMRVPGYGTKLHDGDIINLGGSCVRFQYMTDEQCREENRKRPQASALISPSTTLIELTVLQIALCLQHFFTANREHLGMIALTYATVIALEWFIYEMIRLMGRMAYEIEILAFFLTTLGISVAASSTPEDLDKQILIMILSVALYFAWGWWLRNLKRTMACRFPFAILSLGILAVNIITADTINGAKNWLQFGGYSFQPSELLKVFYIYVGASTLDMLYRKKNLFSFIVYSGICVAGLAIIGDFGTALIFFSTFLIISFMRSGSIATVFLAVSGAFMAAFLAITIKPYIARRFAIWGHAWDDVFDTGYQQTRAMSAAASGGLIGKGAGAGWLKNIVASNTDMVFAYVCEELGLLVGICMVLAVLLMAFFAIRMAKNGRSAYYGIAACATSALLLVQLALNVFGSLDMLPFTGVTFPFVSRGGSSLIACWMLMGYLKSIDTRKDASFAVKPLLNARWEAVRSVPSPEFSDSYGSAPSNGYSMTPEEYSKRYYARQRQEYAPDEPDALKRKKNPFRGSFGNHVSRRKVYEYGEYDKYGKYNEDREGREGREEYDE